MAVLGGKLGHLCRVLLSKGYGHTQDLSLQARRVWALTSKRLRGDIVEIRVSASAFGRLKMHGFLSFQSVSGAVDKCHLSKRREELLCCFVYVVDKNASKQRLKSNRVLRRSIL